ncbi:hypothetical protein [Oceaniglobus roseus]|uniref:hypothetical protein n=1 Tax=Oceaniglobus roseus TaxID=1737570 RepID=UPI000C7F614B|nr:hypothetical protein [Kandeliimicrobium roseum]
MAEVLNPDNLFIQFCCDLYNAVGAAELPDAAGGPYGMSNTVAAALIDLTDRKGSPMGIKKPAQGLKGWCIYASVVAAKFMRHRAHFYESRVVRIANPGDHYFVVAKRDNQTVICDITCSQFGGPAFIAGTLGETAAHANTLIAVGTTLQECYKLGAAAKTFVI